MWNAWMSRIHRSSSATVLIDAYDAGCEPGQWRKSSRTLDTDCRERGRGARAPHDFLLRIFAMRRSVPGQPDVRCAYKTPLETHLLMGTVVGAVYGTDQIRRGKEKVRQSVEEER